MFHVHHLGKRGLVTYVCGYFIVFMIYLETVVVHRNTDLEFGVRQMGWWKCDGVELI